MGDAAPLREVAARLSDGALKETVTAEALLATKAAKFRTWGRHYFLTLPIMLKLERRSNFRDACLQSFGKSATGEDGLIEQVSNEAELVFATLKPPTPSRVYGSRVGASQSYTAMPDEFMRGGGCFGPDATVKLLVGGATRDIKVSAIKAGDQLVGEGGGVATVVCVVMTECVGGKAQLTRLANGLEITEWHPIREASGRWRFPNMVGQRLVRSTPYVYNFVLSAGHPTILVDGIPCAALGHGLEAPVVAHPYWGTHAVIDDLMQKPGWAEGRVIMQAK